MNLELTPRYRRVPVRAPALFGTFDLAQISTVLRVNLEQKCQFFGSGAPGALWGTFRGLSGGCRGALKRIFPRQTGDKGHRKRTPSPRDDLFPRQAGGKVHREGVKAGWPAGWPARLSPHPLGAE